LIPYKPFTLAFTKPQPIASSAIALVLIRIGDGLRVNSCSVILVIVAHSSDIRKSESVHGTFFRKLTAKRANGDPTYTSFPLQAASSIGSVAEISGFSIW